MRLKTLILVAYLIVGVIIAANHHYLSNLDDVRRIVSALLAIVLWPLVLFGVDLHIKG